MPVAAVRSEQRTERAELKPSHEQFADGYLLTRADMEFYWDNYQADFAPFDPNKLTDEIEEQAWFTEPARPGDVFSADPERLWSNVLERMGDEYRLLARMPEDPRMN